MMLHRSLIRAYHARDNVQNTEFPVKSRRESACAIGQCEDIGLNARP